MLFLINRAQYVFAWKLFGSSVHAKCKKGFRWSLLFMTRHGCAADCRANWKWNSNMQGQGVEWNSTESNFDGLSFSRNDFGKCLENAKFYSVEPEIIGIRSRAQPSTRYICRKLLPVKYSCLVEIHNRGKGFLPFARLRSKRHKNPQKLVSLHPGKSFMNVGWKRKVSLPYSHLSGRRKCLL